MSMEYILLGLVELILWYLAKFKRRTIVYLNNRTILDKDKLMNSLSLRYLIAGFVLILLGLIDSFQGIYEQNLVSSAFSIMVLIIVAMNAKCVLKYSDAKVK